MGYGRCCWIAGWSNCGRADLPGRPLLYSTTSLFSGAFRLTFDGANYRMRGMQLRRLDLPNTGWDEKAGKKKDQGGD